jgi:acyl-coenzyme A thioesterase PaaI-like protein
MRKINNHENIIKVLNRFRDIKSSTNICYGKEFTNNIFLIQALEEEKYKKLGMKEGNILFSLKPEQSMINLRNAMHGGSIGTALDIVTTIAMSGLHKDLCLNVTSKLSMNFILPVSLVKNSYILVTKANLLNNNLGFCEADMYDIDDIKLLVKSSHLKSFIDKKWL